MTIAASPKYITTKITPNFFFTYSLLFYFLTTVFRQLDVAISK